jgi:hypothetical protein
LEKGDGLLRKKGESPFFSITYDENMKLILTLALATCAATAHAQTTIIIQPMTYGEALTPAQVIQQTDPKDLAIQQERWDAMIQHNQEQYEKFEKHRIELFNCRVNNWHPENC